MNSMFCHYLIRILQLLLVMFKILVVVTSFTHFFLIHLHNFHVYINGVFFL